MWKEGLLILSMQKRMIEPERRCYNRRQLRLPVMFCRLGQLERGHLHYFGNVSEVGDGGMRIQVKSDYEQSAGSKLVVFIPSQSDVLSRDHGRMVEIKAEVVWSDHSSSSFGLKYL